MSSQEDLIQQLRQLSIEEERYIERLIEVTERRNLIIERLTSSSVHTISRPVSTVAADTTASEVTGQTQESVARAASPVSGVTLPSSLFASPGIQHNEQTGQIKGRQTVVVIHNKHHAGVIGTSTDDFIAGQHVVILSTTKGYKGFKARVTHTEGQWVWVRFKHPKTDKTVTCYRAPKSLLITRNP